MTNRIVKSAYEIVVAGFGGQGILSMGQIIAYSAMKEGKEVSWMPSYGPEMRGGTANCIIIVSDRRISSPIVTKFDIAIILNQPSMEKFESALKPGGFLIYEKSTVLKQPTRKDIEIFSIPALEEAERLKSKPIANMIMVGALLERYPIIKLENVVQGLREILPPHRHNLISLNEQALERGKQLAQQ